MRKNRSAFTVTRAVAPVSPKIAGQGLCETRKVWTRGSLTSRQAVQERSLKTSVRPDHYALAAALR